MTGYEIERFRERRNLSRTDLADLLNSALGRSYDGESVRRWETGTRNASKAVSTFLEELAVSTNLSGDIPTPDQVASVEYETIPGDSTPGPGPTLDPQTPIVMGSSAWSKACEELFEMIATGIGMVGAAMGSQALVNDGAIIAGDKAALGQAYGRLAETNDTFRKMLVGMTEGGAWLQVALVTGTTASKCWQSHMQIVESQIHIPEIYIDDGTENLAA